MGYIRILIFLLCFTATSQIDVGLYQDLKLAVQKDDYGNDPFTTDAILIVKMYNGGNRKDSWNKNLFAYPMLELADIDGGFYVRYGMGIGYKFEFWNINIEPSIDYGRIYRWETVYTSFNGLLSISYKVTPKFNLSILNGYTQRNDLFGKWGTRVWRYNFYVGATYNIEK